jgi:hypothetical protein
MNEFETEAKATDWIANKATAWLRKYRGGRFQAAFRLLPGPPGRPALSRASGGFGSNFGQVTADPASVVGIVSDDDSTRILIDQRHGRANIQT